MFVMTKNKKKVGLIDAVSEIVAMSIRDRSMKPMAGLVRKGRYGTRLTLEGRYLDCIRDRERVKKFKVYTIPG